MRFVSVLTMSILISLTIAFSQETLEVDGTGEGESSEQALLAAKRDAIERGVKMTLLSQTEIENFQGKRDFVLAKTMDALKSFKIISQSKPSATQMLVKINATLLKNIVREDLASLQVLIESMDKPRLMVVVQETNLENNDPGNHAAESSISKYLQDPFGFDIIDPKTVMSIKNSGQKMEILKKNEIEAAAIGTQYGADVLITGSASSKREETENQELGGKVSVGADVTLKAINCATGRIIGSVTQHAVIIHISPLTAGSEAIASAAEKGASILLDTIIKDWQLQKNNGVPLSVSVNNVCTFRMKVAVIQTIKGLSGVSGVHERSWDSKKNVLNVDVQFKGNSNRFRQKIDGYKMRSGGGSIAVTGINGQNINLVAQSM